MKSCGKNPGRSPRWTTKFASYSMTWPKRCTSTGNGAGLAACQVGILKRLVVIDMGEGLMKLVNPEIVRAEGEQLCEEGCLSLPGVWSETRRPERVTVKATDEYGHPLLFEAQGDLAKCCCHEIDHLDGVLFIDHESKRLKGNLR